MAFEDDDFIPPINSLINTTSVHEICPDGDVVLVVEGKYETMRITVSSVVLSLASKVLQIYFTPKYREGVDFAREDRQCPLEIVLQEDIPEAMLELCSVLHHQPYDGGDVKNVYDLAVVVDKYDCSHAIRYYAETKLSWWESKAEWNSGLCDLRKSQLIAAAYLFNSAWYFQRFTSLLVFCLDPRVKTEPLLKRMLSVYLSEQDLNCLCLQATPARLKLIEGVLLMMGATGREHDTEKTNCKDFITKLGEAYLHPFPIKAKRESHATLCTAIGNLNLVASDFDEGLIARTCPSCRIRPLPSRSGTSQIYDVVLSHCRGLCLECVRNGVPVDSLSEERTPAQGKKKVECRSHPADPTDFGLSCVDCNVEEADERRVGP